VAYGVPVRWDKVTIIGVGLLGGSIGLALIRRKLAREICGFVRRKAAVREALKHGAVTSATMDLDDAVTGADLVILSTPISQMDILTTRMLPSLRRGAVVTDVGSVKTPVVRALSPRIREVNAHFVGSHPMAGSEKGSVRAARPDLLQDAVCVVTPDGRTAKTAARKVRQLWSSLGSRVMTLDPELHDKLVSRASHLPHLLASVLVNQVLDPRQDARQAALCASGFQDTTRVACASPAMWRDICLANRKNLVRDLAQFEKHVATLRKRLGGGEAQALEQFLAEAHDLRTEWGSRKGRRTQQ